MTRTLTDYLWVGAMVVLVVLAVPWFLWGDSRLVAGLPLWLWWHVGWMFLASATFYAFTRGPWERLMGVSHG
ncbi:MAG: DUF3311 domain-containing protein [Halobacteriota archaeon]